LKTIQLNFDILKFQNKTDKSSKFIDVHSIMNHQENEDICKKSSSRTLFNIINVVSLLVILISILFTYHYLTPSDHLTNENVEKKESNIINEQVNIPIIKKDVKTTFLDKFKKLDLTQFIDKNVTDQSIPRKIAVENVDQFNNNQLLPCLKSIVDMDYFKYIKLNLNKKCTLWPDDAKCSRKDCTIQTCDESRLPDYIVNTDDMKEHQRLKENAENSKECNDDQILNSTSEQLQQIVNVISNEKLSTMNELFECYVSEYEDGEFYDLKANPEEFTGYKGPTAHRIWRSIYEENCFKSKRIQLNDPTESNSNNVQQFESFLNADDLCLEEKIFYRAISGLHTSINIHLSRYYHFKDGSIGFNLKEFLKRFEGKNEYLKNLYFVFLLELRALNKVGNYLLTKVNWQSSGDQLQTREAIKDVLKVIGKFKWKFDENVFNLKEFRNAEFAEHFHNISTTIMDCVACDKCKLWGKVQIHALGTAFKILLTDFDNKVQLNNFHLHRHEISTLFNGITRLSDSINNLRQFNDLIKNDSPKNLNVAAFKQRPDIVPFLAN